MSATFHPVVTAVCPRCREPFAVPHALVGTYCHECFDEAYGPAVKSSTPWQRSPTPGIIFLLGGVLVALWVVLR